MRKALAVLAAIAIMLPIEGVSGAPAGAASGTRCNALAATAQFLPGLPVISKKKKVASTVTSAGTLKRCTGGGVASGTFIISYKLTGNCTTLLAYTPKPTSVRITTTWNTNKTSTATLQLHAVRSDPTKHTVSGVITAGLFKGLHTSTTFTFALVTKGGCLVRTLKEISVTGGPVVIK
jgi:hypothetical protein